MVDSGHNARFAPLNEGQDRGSVGLGSGSSVVVLTCEFSSAGPRVLYVDDRLAALVGSAPTRLRGAAFGSLLTQPFGLGDLLQLQQALARGVPWQTNVALRYADHPTLRLTFEAVPLWGIADIAFAAVLRDACGLPSIRDSGGDAPSGTVPIHEFPSAGPLANEPGAAPLSTAEQRFRAASVAVQDGYLTMSVKRDWLGKICDFVIADSNQSAATMLSSTVEYIVGRMLSEALPAKHRYTWFGRCAEVVATGVAHLETSSGRDLGVAAKWVRWHAVPTEDGVAISLCDVSWERELSIQLSKSSRLEAIGSLAISIAHDFNNTLSAIIGFGELARDALPLTLAPRNDVEQVVDAAQRAAQLTRFLLAFGKRQPLEPQLVDVSQSLRAVRQLLTRLAGPTVCLEMDLGSSAACWADPGQFEQAIVNLVVNARDAMPYGGVLRISVRATSLSNSLRESEQERNSDSYVCVSVSDNGIGMDAQTRTRIFEPFFTTKGESGGTGLGLASVYGFVKQSGGAISVDSEVGRGTTFRLFFPLVDGARLANPSSERPLSRLWTRATGTILVVEQDPSVRTVVRRALELNRLDVVEADGMEQALSKLRDKEYPIDVLLTALKLFGCGGIELAQLAKRERPSIGIVLMSGAAEMDEVQAAASGIGALFVQKPFSADVLLSKIQIALTPR